MDDEDSKIRRNLVTASAVVLLLAWLKLPLSDVIERVLGAKTSASLQVDAARVWIAVVLVLCYFALRFFYSEPVEKGRAMLSAASYRARSDLITLVIKSELAAFNLFSKGSPVFFRSLHQIASLEHTEENKEWRTTYLRNPDVKRFKLVFETFEDQESPEASENEWGGSLKIGLRSLRKGGGWDGPSMGVLWQMGGLRRWFVMIAAWWKVIWLSRAGLTLLYPTLLFMAALAVAVFMSMAAGSVTH